MTLRERIQIAQVRKAIRIEEELAVLENRVSQAQVNANKVLKEQIEKRQAQQQS